MSLSVGIIGLPNAGKSTLFNALLGKQQAQVAAYPFTTIEPNIGVVDLPDPRLDKLVKILKPGQVRPATISFVDIAGLVKGAHQGEGLGNQFLAHIRETDAMIHVIDAFSKEAAVNEDLETVHLELILKDFETVSRKQEQLAKKAKGRVETPKELALKQAVDRLSTSLGEGKLARLATLSPEEMEAVKELFLLTMKPEVIVINLAEEALLEDQAIEYPQALSGYEVVMLAAKTEMDLAELSKKEQQEYRQELGLPPSNLGEVIGAGYRALDLITFYTIKGGKIVQAWPVEKGTTVLEAADLIHTDLAKKFIVAELISVERFVNCRSWLEAKKAGKVKTAGRNDLVEDGLIIEIKT